MEQAPDIDGQPVQLTVDSTGAPFGGPGDPVVQVFSTLRFDVALSSSGNVYSWGFSGNDGGGNDSRGIVGDGTAFDPTACPAPNPTVASCGLRSPHKAVFPSGTVIKKVTASSSIILALDQTGALWTWGGNGLGIGNGEGLVNSGGTPTTTTAPQRLTQGLASPGGALVTLPAFVDMKANIAAAYALDAQGDLWGWGSGWTMLIGAVGSYNPVLYPTKLTHVGNTNFANLETALARAKIVGVYLSYNSIHLLLDDGELWGWGQSDIAEVGNGQVVNFMKVTTSDAGTVINDGWSFGPTLSPVQEAVPILPHVRKVFTSQFSFHVMVQREDGTLYSWGRNANGVLGNDLLPGDYGSSAFLPYEPISPASYTPDIYDVPVPTWVQPF